MNAFQIFRDHALKNSMLPMITIIALTIGYTVGGAIQVETVFSWPGMGRLFITAVMHIESRDITMPCEGPHLGDGPQSGDLSQSLA